MSQFNVVWIFNYQKDPKGGVGLSHAPLGLCTLVFRLFIRPWLGYKFAPLPRKLVSWCNIDWLSRKTYIYRDYSPLQAVCPWKMQAVVVLSNIWIMPLKETYVFWILHANKTSSRTPGVAVHILQKLCGSCVFNTVIIKMIQWVILSIWYWGLLKCCFIF